MCERNICQLPLVRDPIGDRPATQACARTGNQTSDPLVHRPALNPLSHTSQGSTAIKVKRKTAPPEQLLVLVTSQALMCSLCHSSRILSSVLMCIIYVLSAMAGRGLDSEMGQEGRSQTQPSGSSQMANETRSEFTRLPEPWMLQGHNYISHPHDIFWNKHWTKQLAGNDPRKEKWKQVRKPGQGVLPLIWPQ